MRVSVVVPTRDRVAELLALLEALNRQTRRPDEIVIVDSSSLPLSQTGYAARMERTAPGATYLRSAPGVSRQRNLGARRATGDLIFFLDDDVLPRPDFIEIMTETFLRHPDFWGGMGTLEPTTARRSPGALLCRLFLLQHEYGDGRFGWSGMPRHPYGTKRFAEVHVMGGGLMAVRRAVFADDGVEFDDRLTQPLEDWDFSLRLSRKRRLFFNPAAQVEHRPSPIGRQVAFEQARRYMFNFRYLYLKNFFPAAPWSLPAHWWSLAGMLIVAALTGPSALLPGYLAGLLEFDSMRRGRASGIFEPKASPEEPIQSETRKDEQQR